MAVRGEWRRLVTMLAAPVLLLLAVVVWRLGTDLRATRDHHAVGDGRHPRTYGFDLANLAYPESLLAAGGVPRDGLPTLDRPPLLTPAGVDSLNEAERGKYLVGADRVLGAVVRGEARCWPLRVLDWHEVCLDTLGGAPLAATWSPLTGSAAVYGRAAGGDTLRFGVSGLLLNSNTLLFDRAASPSLWCQLTGEAVAGPRRGERLPRLPAVVTTWEHWRREHPGTTVPAPAPTFKRRYQSRPYLSYRSGGRTRFPSAPLPAAGPLDPLLIVGTTHGRHVLDAARVVREAGPDGVWSGEVNGIAMKFRTAAQAPGEQPAVWTELEFGDGITIYYADRFAWHAFHPEDRLP
ncbi:MAG: DUF3179 domain-containing protein [bacterium]|nr:DUF3179 domain-containing protein [bacterium]